MAKRSSDDYDLDHTDELPILLETVVLPEDTAADIDDTAGHTALHGRLEADEAHDLHLPQAATRSEEIDALEAQLRGIADLNRELGRQLTERDRLIDDLETKLATVRARAEEAAGAQRQLATQLALRDAKLAELSATMERLQQESVAKATEIERLRTAAENARLEAEAARKDTGSVPAASAPAGEIDSLRDENAALSSYIEGRRKWWNELQTAHQSLATRAAALAHELASGEKRRAAAADLAARESARASALRAELATYARRVEDLERELKRSRPADSALIDAHDAAGMPAAVLHPQIEVQPTDTRTMPSPSPPGETLRELPPPAAEAAPVFEALAQLETEVAYKRQQVAAQLVELHERERQLRATTDELERLRQQHTALRAELNDSHAATARLEQTVIDKDRALAARDSRIGTLQEEIDRRPAAEDWSPEALAKRRADVLFGEPAPELTMAVPALLCLTGDAPPRFRLTKDLITVGRGMQCDLQILSHCVSREHARIRTIGEITIIEDLGSRNGVYVNAARVDRHELHHGDVVVIGETQFRFVEPMGH